MEKGIVTKVLWLSTFILLSLLGAGVCMADDGPPEGTKFNPLVGPYLGQEPPGDTPMLFAPGNNIDRQRA